MVISHITETSSFEADIDVLDTAADELEGIREKIEKENDPAKQKVLKKEYKEKMKNCMHNMEHLDEKIAKKNSMKGGDKKKKMKKTVEMNDERIIVLEKKVELLQEMLAGLLLQ